MNRDNPELQLGHEFVRETGCNVFLTGKAGTGKTTFLHNIKKDCNKRMVVTAPTGVAAINAGGVTLHSFFQMPFGPFIPGSESTRQHKFNREKINLIKSLDILVIDEISMVRADLLDGIDSVLRRYRRSNLPFGGVQLLLIGDLHQLAPVVKNEDWRILGPYYDSPYFFSSKALGKTELISIELQHIYRQADSHFINLLNRVRDNKLDRESLAALNTRHDASFQEKAAKKSGYITLCTHNRNADSINESRLKQLSNKIWRFNAEIEGDFPEHSYPTPPALELKIDSQVMFVRNDSSHEKRYFNGKIGKIIKISGEKIYIKCPDDPEEIMVEPATWENIEYSLDQETMEVSENKVGAFVQYPLKLAWAITIHKSQGLTFEHAIIDAQAAFAHGQVYVALSRCRTLEGMVLSSPLSQSGVKTDRTVLQFTEHAGQNLPTAEKLAAAKIRYQQGLIIDCFDFKRLQYLLSRLVAIAESNGDLLHIKGAGNLIDLQQTTITDITKVGFNFIQQLRGLFNDAILPADDPVIEERVKKASHYFNEKLSKNLTKVIPVLEAETDNKEIRKKAKRLISQLQEETGVKLAAVNCCANGFNSSAYIKAISSAEIISKPKPIQKTSTVYTEMDVEHPKLYDSLKKWRTKKSKGENLTPFQVMHQKTMIQIVVNLPSSIPELMKIKGIGNKLADRYGDELVEMVRSYRKKHGIEEVHLPTPQQLPDYPASPPAKEKKIKINTKQESYKLFKKGMEATEIAKERGLTVQTIESHLAYFIAKGEIDLQKFVNSARQSEIEEQLLRGKGKNLSEIKAALGPDYSYSEIKFVQAHLKFSSS